MRAMSDQSADADPRGGSRIRAGRWFQALVPRPLSDDPRGKLVGGSAARAFRRSSNAPALTTLPTLHVDVVGHGPDNDPALFANCRCDERRGTRRAVVCWGVSNLVVPSALVDVNRLAAVQ
jgi:hypothetical protein